MFQPWMTAVGVMLLGGAAALVVDDASVDHALVMEQGVTAGRLSPRRAALEAALNEPLVILRGVAGFLAVRWGITDFAAEFDRYAAHVLAQSHGEVRSIQYVLDGTIVHSYPLAGNEEAIGRDLARDPRPLIARDYQTASAGGEVALSGPTDLFQGGRGLIGRLRAPGAASDINLVAGVIIDMDTMLVRAGFPELALLAWRLRDAEGALIAGQATLDTTLGGIVSLPVRLPDRRWTLDAVPTGGWAAGVDARRLPVRLNLAAGVLVLGLIAGMLHGRRLTQRQTEWAEARYRAEEKFRNLFALCPDGVVLARADDTGILEVNEAYCQIFHRPREALVGRTMDELGLADSPTDQAAARTLLDLEGSQLEQRFGIRLPDGTRREGIYSSVSVVLDGIPCYLSIVRDVQERLTIEQRLADAQRLEAIGRLAGGIAHDFNNLITGIAGYADLARIDLADGDPRRADLDEISRAARRAADLTRQLLTFARRQVTAPRVVDLAGLTREASGLLRRLVGDRVTLVLELPDHPLPVLADPAQLEQVLTNLVANARDAMPQGGLVVISATGTDAIVELVVTDTGSGIEPQHLNHLFEPFYTTKATGAGTGLGLATVHGIVEQAGGSIEVESVVGDGATFRIRLPRAAGIPASGPILNAAVAPRGGTEVILIAEDEPQVRALAARVLGGLGYVVLTAEDGTEALALAASHHGPLDLLLTDMVMPRMGGGELVRRLRELHPGLHVLLMSGYSEELIAAEHNDLAFLPKPFTPQELAEAVRAALDG